MCYKSGKDEMHHYIIEKIECLHHEITELKEKMEFFGLKMKHLKEKSCHSFARIEGKLECIGGQLHHEFEEIEEGLNDLCACSAAMESEHVCNEYDKKEEKK